jgi:hypothetical protein
LRFEFLIGFAARDAGTSNRRDEDIRYAEVLSAEASAKVDGALAGVAWSD